MCFGGRLRANTSKTRTIPQDWRLHAVVLVTNETESWCLVKPQRDVMNSLQTSLTLTVIALTSYHSVLTTPSLRSALCDGDGYHLCMSE